MKNKFLPFVITAIISLIGLRGYSQWNYAGAPAFSAGTVSQTATAVDRNGTVYIAYQDMSDDSAKITVKKFSGGSWVTVGIEKFTGPQASQISLAIDSASGTPYVAYEDRTYSVNVQKFNGTAWVYVGSPNFTYAESPLNSVAVSKGVPYIFFQDYRNNFQATVAMFNDTGWLTIGPVGFTAGSVKYLSLVIDHHGKIYAGYEDATTPNNQITVSTFNGAAWVPVGTTGFSAQQAYYISLAVDSNDNLYAAFSDLAASTSLAASVMRFNAGTSTWAYLGGQGFTPGEADYVSLAISPRGVPTVAFSDCQGIGKQASVMQFNGIAWVQTGTADFSAGEADYTSLVFAPNGTPFVGYVDFGNTQHASVKEFGPTGIVSENDGLQFSVYPNPNNGQFEIRLPAGGTDELQFSLINTLGQKILQNTVQQNSGQSTINMNAQSLARGIYVLQAKTINGTSSRIIEVQ